MSRSILLKSSSPFATDELANQITHGLGFALTIPAGWWLLRAAAEKQNDWMTVGCLIYAITMSLLYAASTLSHSFQRGTWRHRFRTFDQVCIFLFMAGCYTPFGLTYLREGPWGLLLAAMWLLAIAGIVMKLFFTRLHTVAMSFYLMMGWIPILALPHFLRCFGVEGVAWILAGGVAYSVGTWFLVNDQRRLFYHAIWHLMTILGSACHYFLILKFVVGCVG